MPAERAPRVPSCPHPAVLGLAALPALLMAGQAAAQSSGFTVTPGFSVQQTLTDNRNLSATDEQSEAVTTISPGVSISSRSGRVQGSLSYSLNALIHARQSERNTLQNALSASVRGELVEQRAFVDVAASISQRTVSAFGTQAGPTGLVNDNTTEVSSLSISPSLRGNLAGLADVSATLRWSTSSSAGTDLGDNVGTSGTLGLSGRSGPIGWGVSASRQISDFAAGRRTAQDSASGSLGYSVDPTLQLSLNGGWEAQDVLNDERSSSNTWGYGVSWRPTERTSASLQSSRRFFGRSHSLSLSHRMARSVWSYSDSRSISGGQPVASERPLTLFDLLYSICVRETLDPIACERSVRDQLLLQGLNPGTIVSGGGGFLTSAQSVQRSQNASMALSGLRSTFTFSAFRSQSRRLGAVTSAQDDLARTDALRQLGFSVAMSYRLTPTDGLSLAASRQKTPDTATAAGNQQRTVTLSWNGSLGRRAGGSLSLRHAVAESPTNPYTETGLVGSLSLRF